MRRLVFTMLVEAALRLSAGAAELSAVTAAVPAAPTAEQHAAWKRAVGATVEAFAQKYAGTVTVVRTEYASRDARVIPAYVFSPPTAGPVKTLPGLIILHGSNHGHFGPEYFDLIARAVTEGYVVLFPEFRGSAGYGADHYEALDYGGKEVDDVLAAADHLVASDRQVDAARLGIYGYSHGGLIALCAIEQAPRRFKAVVHVDGLADMVAYVAAKSPAQQKEIARQPSFHGRRPDEDLSPYLAASPINFVDRIEVPVLIISTTSDDHVPVRLHGQRLADALRERGKTCDYLLCENAPGGHEFTYHDSPARREAFDRTFRFLEKYVQR
ncbi:MAG: hypothetical protein JWM88_1093 [Verrucomicrobia bacterium]|nr:hypothetical protein [Verrucomicrobiota bacterium]